MSTKIIRGVLVRGAIVWGCAFMAMAAFFLVPFLPDRRKGRKR